MVSTNQSQALPPSAFRLLPRAFQAWCPAPLALLVCVLLLSACTNEEVIRVKVAEAEATGRQAAQGVENYFKKHRRYPKQLEEAYVRPTPLQEIKLMSVDPKTGVVRVTLSFRPVEGKSLLFVPTRKAKSFTWRCTSEDIEPKFLPEACGGGAGKAK